MKTKILILLFTVLVFNYFGQEKQITIANWNLENLFDVEDDPNKDDQEFLPSSAKEWTQERLTQKFKNLSKVITAMNDGTGPDLIGVEEVEHQSLLDSLVQKYLEKNKYNIAYAESPDNRGIDVGLIYNDKIMDLIKTDTLSVELSDKYPTRLILCAKLLLFKKDTIAIYVNHWPSRRGGEEESENNRIAAAEVLRKSIDEELRNNPEAKIVVVGDFNDEPENKSIFEVLKAKDYDCVKSDTIANGNLFNLAYAKSAKGEGSYLYQQNWNMLDQIMISAGLYKNYVCNSFEIFKPEFLVTKSGKFKGAAFPTYGGGNRYLGGYSDHLPVTAYFSFK